MQNFGFVGPAGQFFKLLDAKTKRAKEAVRELKEMQFERMITKGQDDPYDLKHLYDHTPKLDGVPCYLDYHTICGKQDGESCQGCPVWEKIDGE